MTAIQKTWCIAKRRGRHADFSARDAVNLHAPGATRRALLMLALTAACFGAPALAAQPVKAAAGVADGFINVTSATPATGKPAARSDVSALLDALAAGNAPTVHRLAARLNLNGVSRRMLRAQLDYDIPGLVTAATQCRNEAFAKHLVPAAARCDGVALGASKAWGDAHTMFHALAWGQKIGLPALARKAGYRTATFDPAFDSVDAAALARSIPPLRAHMSDTQTTIPMANRRLRHGANGPTATRAVPTTMPQPDVDIVINGHLLRALVDTDEPSALTVSAAVAKAVGIRALVAHEGPDRTLLRPRGRPGSVSLGLAAAFQFGPLTLHNLLVRVVTGPQTAHPATVGLPILARFPQVTFTDRSIIVGRSTGPCSRPLELTNAQRGIGAAGHLVFAARVGTRPVTASFDSGANDLLLARTELDHQSRELAPDGIQAIHHGYLALDIGAGQIASYAAAFLVEMPRPVDVLIGAPLLASANVQLDFAKHGSPSLCILPGK